MTIPAIYSAAYQYPDTRFIVTTKPFFSRIFINKPANVELLPIDLKEYKGIKGLCLLIKKLHQQKPNAVADFHNVLRTWLINFSFWINFIPVAMLNKERGNRSKKNLKKECRPFVYRYFDVLNRLGLDTYPQFKSVFERNLSQFNLPSWIPDKKSKKWIGLAPFARYINKSYPYIQGAKLIKELNDLDCQLFLFGGGDNERINLETWTKNISGPIILVGKLSIEEEIMLMSKLDIMISMDSANMHLAAIAGTRVVSLWGGTAPSCGFLGWNQKKEDTICMNLPCQPCTVAGSNQCKMKDFQCWSGITPEIVCLKVVSILTDDDKN